MAQASSDNGMTIDDLGAYLYGQFGPDGLRGPMFNNEFIDQLKLDQARSAEWERLPADDRRFVHEINRAILDSRIRDIIAIGTTHQFLCYAQRFLIQENIKKITQNQIEYTDGTRVSFFPIDGFSRRTCGMQVDTFIVHEYIGWKQYEKIRQALIPCIRDLKVHYNQQIY